MLKRLIVAVIVGTLICGCSTSEDDDNGNDSGIHTILTSDTLTVAETVTEIKTANGAKVDFGYSLEEGEKVIVEKVNMGSTNPDVEIYAYNIELSSGKQPDGSVVITLPYDETGLSAESERSSICGKYYNEQTKEWEDVIYTVNTVTNEVQITTDHFSIYGVFKVTNPAKRNAYISDINMYADYMTSEQAEAIIKKYAEQGASWPEDVVSAYLGATGTVDYFTSTNTHTLLTLGGAYSDLVSQPFQNNMTKLGIATACVQFTYDAYNNGISSKKTAISAMKTTLGVAVNYASSSAIQLAYITVGIVDLALTEVLNFAIATKYKSTKNMYDEYYNRPENKRKIKDWRKRFNEIYENNKTNPQVVQDSILAEIDNYVNKYWSVASSDWESWVDAYDKNGTLSDYPWPLKEDQETISNNFKNEIFQYLTSLFYYMSKDIQYDIMAERESSLKQIAAQLNKIYTIKINEYVESDMIPQLPNCLVKMAPLPGNISAENWIIKLDENGTGTLKFTVLAHENAGFPMTLEFYKSKEDLEKGIVAQTYTLSSFESQEVAVTIKTAKEAIDFSGTYEGTLLNVTTGVTTDVTTVVTFEEVMGDGGKYEIVCSNGSSKYIMGSHFVRNTGVVNLPGSDFKFSADGTSFSATMKNAKNEAWGIINGTKQ